MTRLALKKRLMIATAVTLTLAMAHIAAPAQAAPTSEGQKYLDQAISLEKAGKFTDALIQLKNAVGKDPGLLPARYELGLLYLRIGDPKSAQVELEAARAKGFDENKIMLPLMQAYLARGKFQDVMTKFDPDKFSGDAQAEVLAAQARAQLALQNVDAARVLTAKALAQAPRLPMALIAAATIARVDQKYPEAEKYVDQALEVAPDNVELLVLKGEARAQAKDFDGAMKPVDRAIEKYPRQIRARTARALLNVMRDKIDALPEDVTAILEIDARDPMGLYLRAVILAHEQKYRDAVADLLSVPDFIDQYPPARYLLAAAALGDNQLQTALSNAELYLKKVPGELTGSKLLAAVSIRVNDPGRAVEVLEPFVLSHPDDNQLRLQLASAYLGAGRSDDAAKLFEEGVKKDPQNTDARMALAVSQLRSGAADAGIAQLEKLVQTKPDSLEVSRLLVMTHVQAKHYDKAREAVDALIKADPKSAAAYNLKGFVDLSAREIPAATASFKLALDKDAKFTPAMLNLARLEQRGRDVKAAKIWYAKVLAIDPRNMAAYNDLTALAIAEKKPDEAAKILERAIAANPTNFAPRLQLVNLRLDTKQAGSALVAARDLADLAANDPVALELLGRAQIANGDAVAGLASYRQLVTLLPKNAEAKRRLGRALVDAARGGAQAGTTQLEKPADKARLMAEAKNAFDEALTMAPDYPAALGDRLTLERESSGDAAALRLAQDFVRARPDSIPRMIVLGDFATAVGKHDVALTSYRAAWDKGKSGETLRVLYGAMVRTGKGPEGLQMLKAWAVGHDTDFDTRFLIASAYISDGKYDDAIKETEAMNSALPDNPFLLNNLAWLYGEKGNPRAFEVGQKALDLAPNSAEIMDTLGWMETRKRDLKKGVALLAKSYELAPSNSTIGYHYAVALQQGGDKKGARNILKKSLEGKAAFAERADAETLLKALES